MVDQLQAELHAARNRIVELERNGRKRGRISELAPAWIGALAALIVALTGAGFFAGRASVPIAAQTPATIPFTATSFVPTPAGNAGASDSPTSPPASANGTLLGSYSININAGHSVPLGPTKPTQADFTAGGAGDLGTATPADHLVFVPINGDKMLSLPGGTTPTYQACAQDTVFVGQADSVPGTSFCLIETGRMAGVIVTSGQPTYVVLQVTVWQHTAS
jgi:hypothetical protein